MLQNNNLKICLRLTLRDLRFHKLRNILMALAISLVTGLYAFVFLLGSSVENAFLLNSEYTYGSASHIQYLGLTSRQADAIAHHPDIKSSVRLSTIGFFSGETIGDRYVKLAVTDRDYAKTVLSLPTSGRLPEKDDEIALDEFTMNSLGITHELGQTIRLEWVAFDGTPQTTDFVLCGWWASPTNFTEACAWITSGCAKRLAPDYDTETAANVTLGVMLHQPRDLELQAAGILGDLGIAVPSYTTNLAFNDVRRETAGQMASRFYMPGFLILLCGFLMIYSILHVAVEQDIRYYAELKTLGMTPRQIRRMLLDQVSLQCLLSLLPGWLAGFGIHYAVTPRIVTGMEQNPAIYFLSWQPFILAGLLSWLTALAAALIPALRLSRLTPGEALRLSSFRLSAARGSGNAHTTLLKLAAGTIRRNRGRTILSLLSLLLATVLLCMTWILYTSYDEELFLAAYSPWDYSIADGSAYFSIQRYNQNNQAITDETVSELAARPEVRSVSTLKTREVTLNASPELIALTTQFYNRPDESGYTRRESMSGYPGWYEGLKRLEQTGEYIGIVVGIDGVYLDYLLNYGPLTDGAFDPELFSSGRYVLSAGASSDELSSLPAGSHITLKGREFEVMCALSTGTAFINGSNSASAEFCFYYYLPLQTFNELFPGQGIRQIAVNIDHSRQTEFEAYLKSYEQSLNQGVAITMRSEYQNVFETARLNAELTNLIIGIILLIIGILNFVNMLVTKTIVRRKEFAVYESLGMSAAQLRRLLLLEGLLHAGLLTVVIAPVTILLTWYGMPLLFDRMNTWCMIYRYTLTPMWVTLPLILAAAVLVHFGCLRFVTRGSITERLRTVE